MKWPIACLQDLLDLRLRSVDHEKLKTKLHWARQTHRRKTERDLDHRARRHVTPWHPHTHT